VTRVIAGVAGGRRLSVPPGTSTRPTSDRAREGLFASVMSEFGDLGGMHVMDLYAGSGALGLEALSRGAASVLLVESDARAAAVVKANVEALGLPGATGSNGCSTARPASTPASTAATATTWCSPTPRTR
jgi:16S rRNA (guanine966-N2)-methyltransferase